MRIMLAKPPFARLLGSTTYRTYPLGLMYTATMLHERGHEVIIYHDDVSNPAPLPDGRVVLGEMQVAPLTDEVCVPFAAALERYQPDVVGVSYTTADRQAAHQFAKMAKHRGIRTVAGGVHPSLCAAGELATGVFDALVMGEGDDERAAHAFEGEITEIVCGRQEHLDRYLPARDEVVGAKYPDFLRGHIATQRGCPYACAYCAAPTVFGTKVRRRDPQAVRAEVDALGVAHGRIIDDSFGVVRAHGLAVCAALAGSGYRWICDIALQNVDEEMAEALVAGGCERACMGVESASPRWRELSGKKVAEGEVEAAVALLRDKGVGSVVCYFMLGFPGETLAEMQATLAWGRMLKAQGAEVCVSLVTLYPGTKLLELAAPEQRPRWNAGLLHQSGKARYGDVTEREWRNIIEEARQI